MGIGIGKSVYYTLYGDRYRQVCILYTLGIGTKYILRLSQPSNGMRGSTCTVHRYAGPSLFYI